MSANGPCVILNIAGGLLFFHRLDSPEIPTCGLCLALVYIINVVPIADPIDGTSHVAGTCVVPFVAKLVADREVCQGARVRVQTPVSHMGRAPA